MSDKNAPEYDEEAKAKVIAAFGSGYSSNKIHWSAGRTLGEVAAETGVPLIDSWKIIEEHSGSVLTSFGLPNIYTMSDAEVKQLDLQLWANFGPLLLCMATTYIRNKEEKGDSWKNMTSDALQAKLEEEVAEWSEAKGTDNEPSELIDMILCMMMLVGTILNENTYAKNAFKEAGLE